MPIKTLSSMNILKSSEDVLKLDEEVHDSKKNLVSIFEVLKEHELLVIVPFAFAILIVMALTLVLVLTIFYSYLEQ